MTVYVANRFYGKHVASPILREGDLELLNMVHPLRSATTHNPRGAPDVPFLARAHQDKFEEFKAYVAEKYSSPSDYMGELAVLNEPKYGGPAGAAMTPEEGAVFFREVAEFLPNAILGGPSLSGKAVWRDKADWLTEWVVCLHDEGVLGRLKFLTYNIYGKYSVDEETGEERGPADSANIVRTAARDSGFLRIGELPFTITEMGVKMRDGGPDKFEKWLYECWYSNRIQRVFAFIGRTAPGEPEDSELALINRSGILTEYGVRFANCG